MARTRVFISSTFYNLKEVRAALEQFVHQMGYDAVVTDNITYLPGQDSTSRATRPHSEARAAHEPRVDEGLDCSVGPNLP